MARIKRKSQKPGAAKSGKTIVAEEMALRKLLQKAKHRPLPLRRRHYRPSDVALRKMHKHRTKSLLLPKMAFMRLARDIAHEASRERLSFTSRAVEGLQASCEQFVTSYFIALKLCADHAERNTLMLEDSNLVKCLMRIAAPACPLCDKPKQ